MDFTDEDTIRVRDKATTPLLPDTDADWCSVASSEVSAKTEENASRGNFGDKSSKDAQSGGSKGEGEGESDEGEKKIVATDPTSQYEIVVCDDFAGMDLKFELLRGIYAYGYERPSEIQKRAILPAIRGFDLVAQAQSGTGKTATFSIAMLQTVDETIDDLQGLIISPVRELADQSHKVIKIIGQNMNTRIFYTAGGTKVQEDLRSIEKIRPHIIVATPGRLLQLLTDAYINPRFIRFFIMDEADVLLGENFQPTIRDILGQLNGDTQIGLYTATISSEMEQIIPKIMRKNYVDIRVKKEQLTLEGITQYFVTVPDNDHAKAETLVDIFSRITIGQIIIYCNLQRTAEFLTRKLKMGLHTIPCECMHGKMDTFARKDIMSRFREGDVRVLVTTDMLARGIDVQQLSLVINYDFPTNKENYIHRIGRSGRYGRKGKALNLVTFRDVKIVRETEEYYDTQFLELPGDTIRNALGV